MCLLSINTTTVMALSVPALDGSEAVQPPTPRSELSRRWESLKNSDGERHELMNVSTKSWHRKRRSLFVVLMKLRAVTLQAAQRVRP